MTPPEKAHAAPFGPEIQLMLGRSAGFAVSFFIPVVLVRMFDQAAFGTYKQLFLVLSTLYLITQGGMAESLFYFVPQGRERGGRYVANAALCLGALGLVSGLLVWMEAPRIAAWMNNDALASLLPWIGAILFLMLTAAGLEIVMIARGRYLWAAASYGLSDLARSLMFIVPAILTRRLEWVLAGGVVFAGLRAAAALGYFAREFGSTLRPGSAPLKTQLFYALPFGAAVLVEVLQGNIHQYVIAARFDAATFAIYAVGCLQIPFVDFVAGPAGNVMMVRMSEKLVEKDHAAVVALWHQTTLRLAMVFFPMVALVLVLARDLIVILFTPAYVASVPIFMAWTLSILFAVLQTDGVLRVYAQMRFLLLVNIVRLVLIVGSIYWFLSIFGLLGAVLVTLSGVAVAKGLMLFRMNRLLGTRLSGLLPWRGLVSTAGLSIVAAVPAWAINEALDSHPMAGVLVAGATYAALYLAALYWVKGWPGAAGRRLEALGVQGG